MVFLLPLASIGIMGASYSSGGEAEQVSAKTQPRKAPYLRDIEERLSQAVGTRVQVRPGRAKNTGRIVIDYYSLDDFDGIAERLGIAPAD